MKTLFLILITTLTIQTNAQLAAVSLKAQGSNPQWITATPNVVTTSEASDYIPSLRLSESKLKMIAVHIDPTITGKTSYNFMNPCKNCDYYEYIIGPIEKPFAYKKLDSAWVIKDAEKSIEILLEIRKR